jgi:hypothetical protein
MNGGLPIWFCVSDRQIAVLRMWCLRIMVFGAGGFFLHDFLRNPELGATPLLMAIGMPLMVVAIVLSMIAPTVRLRLFWLLPPVSLGLLATAWGYASWISLDAAAILFFGILIVTILAALTWVFMTMPELGSYKKLHYMSPGWTEAKD